MFLWKDYNHLQQKPRESKFGPTVWTPPGDEVLGALSNHRANAQGDKLFVVSIPNWRYQSREIFFLRFTFR